jgi:L-lactate dehydrogenase (cytochrome)
MSAVDRAYCIADLKRLARKRIPNFAFDYIEEGCNDGIAVSHNRQALDSVQLVSQYTAQYQEPNLTTTLFGRQYDAPVGIAPLGLSGLVWPKASIMHARTARQANVPFVLSTVSTISIETAAQHAANNLWFQLYPPADREICLDLLSRTEAVGCTNLVVTIDVPTPSRRIKALKSGLSVPPKISVGSIWQSCLRPQWSLATVAAGLPQFANLTPYMDTKTMAMADAAEFIRNTLRDVVDLAYLQWLRQHWHGQLIVKGVMSVADAKAIRDIGADGIIVSNHGGRQLDAAPSPVMLLPDIMQEVGADMTVLADSGVESGVDVARYLALGAQAVLSGRPFMYGVGAGGQAGSDKCIELLRLELQQVMSQLHCGRVDDFPNYLYHF